MSTRKDGVRKPSVDRPKKEKTKTEEEASLKATRKPTNTVTDTTKRRSVISVTDPTKKRTATTSSRDVPKPKPKPTTAAKTSSSTNPIKKSSSVDKPSSRVTRTQYYPSKQMISNAVKAKRQEETTKSKNDESDVSITESISERPRTATLRKGSIVNMNIAGPEAPKQPKKTSTTKQASSSSSKSQQKPLETSSAKSESDEYNYEDDFDSYESDFEEYNPSNTSSISEDLSDDVKKTKELEEERKMDSGHFELPEYKHKHILDNIRESIEQENNVLNRDSRNSNLTSLSDEGFVETNLGVPFINFAEAQRKYRLQKSAERRKKRGSELINLIKLDSQSFTLLELEPVPYGTFIKLYGSLNTSQISTQTGDDDINEEIQTDPVDVLEKWTQYPPVLSTTCDDVNAYRESVLGVGQNVLEITDSLVKFDKDALSDFLSHTSKLVLSILDERNQYSLGNINGISDVLFSNGYVDFNTSKNILEDFEAISVTFSNTEELFVSVHSRKCGGNELDSGDASCSMLCVWNVYNPEEPLKMVSCYGTVTSSVFTSKCEHLLAGFLDGSVCGWNMGSSCSFLQVAAFSTPLEYAHGSKVVSIKCLFGNSDNSQEQICTLDEEGLLVFWALLVTKKGKRDVESLAKNSAINLQNVHADLPSLVCTNMEVSLKNTSHIFISTNYGYIIHCLANNSKPIPMRFCPVELSEATCISCCPFSSDYFLVGHADGSIYLYSSSIGRCLKALTNKAEGEDNKKIEVLEWSQTKPFVFYAKDVENNIHIWDLEASDLFPVYTIPFREDLTHMKLAPYDNNAEKKSKRSYMVVVTTEGSIHLHLLNAEHGPQTNEKYHQDVKMFFKYVNRL